MCASISSTAWRPSARGIWIDIVGGYAVPAADLRDPHLFHLALVPRLLAIDEVSSNAGGLIRWPVKLLMPVGFC